MIRSPLVVPTTTSYMSCLLRSTTNRHYRTLRARRHRIVANARLGGLHHHYLLEPIVA